MAGLTLMNVVQEWLASKGKPENQRARLYTIALAGFRELHLDVNGIIKIVELCINDNDTVDLPNDFINYRKIGIVGGDGRIHAMGRDNSINLHPDCGLDGRDIQKSDGVTTFNGLPFAGSFWGVTDGNGGLFGLGGGNNTIGYYRYNRATQQLWLSGLSGVGVVTGGTIRSVIVEYIADISAENEDDFIVHPYAVQVIKDWISWQLTNDDKNSRRGDIEAKRRDYFNSLRICKNRYGSSTPEEWKEALQKANSASVRF